MDHLTAPADLIQEDEKRKYVVRPTVELSDEQAQNAADTLIVKGALEKIAYFPRVDRYICDPTFQNQKFCIHSFVPAKGATPDKDGIFGMMKCRGTFTSEPEMNSRAEDIIRNIDSYHELFHGYVGKPFPFSVNSKYVDEEVEIDIKKKIVEEISSSVREKRKKEKIEKEEVNDQKEELNYDVSDNMEEDPAEYYTGIRVKRANLIHTIIKTKEHLSEMQDHLRKACSEIKKLDKASRKRYKKVFIERYMAAREKAGIPEDDDSLIKYLGDSLPEGIYD
jgi:hypothetical protein